MARREEREKRLKARGASSGKEASSPPITAMEQTAAWLAVQTLLPEKGVKFDGDGTAEEVAVKAFDFARTIRKLAALSPALSMPLQVALAHKIRKFFPAKTPAGLWFASWPGLVEEDDFGIDMDELALDFVERFQDEIKVKKLILSRKLRAGEAPEQFAADLVVLNKMLKVPFNDGDMVGMFVERIPASVIQYLNPKKPWAKVVSKAQIAYEKASGKEKGGAKVHAVEVRGAGQVAREGGEAAQGQRPYKKYGGASGDRSGAAGGEVRRCYKCDSPDHLVRACPEAVCTLCSAKGHLASVCHQLNGKKYAVSSAVRVGRSARVATVSGPGSGERIYVHCHFGGKPVTALVDPGAQASVVRTDLLSGAKWSRVQPAWSALRGFTGGKAVVVAYGARAGLSVGSVSICASVLVVGVSESDELLILGADVLESLGLMEGIRTALGKMGAEAVGADGVALVGALEASGGKNDREERGESLEAIEALDLSHLDALPVERDRLRAILRRFRLQFLKEGRLPGLSKLPEARLRVVGKPVIVRARAWSEEQRQRLEIHENLLIDEGLAEWVSSSAWRGEPLLVWKTGGGTRYTGDYKAANVSLLDEAFPMPNIREELEKIFGGGAFSHYDMAYGFWQQGMEKKSREVTTLRGTKGLIQLKRACMGHKPAPGQFNHAVRTYLVGRLSMETQKRTAQYLDDIAHSSLGKWAEAVRAEVDKIEKVLLRAEELDVVFRLPKCKFAVPSIVFCGYESSVGGQRIDPDRTAALLAMGEINTKAELRRFTAMANRYRSQIKRLDLILAPLFAAQKSGGKLVKSSELSERVELVKKECAEAIMRNKYDPSVPSQLYVDGSGIGFGAFLEQEGKLIACFSRVKTKAELNYFAYDTEWRCITWALKQVEFYTSGSKFPVEVISDSKSLDALETRVVEDKTNKRAGWLEELRTVRYRVTWQPRDRLVAPDALSKSPAFAVEVAKMKKEALELEVSLRAGVASGAAVGLPGEPLSEKPLKLASVVSAVVSTKHLLEPRSVITAAVKRGDDWWRERQMRDPRVKELIEFKEGRPPTDNVKSLMMLAARAERLEMREGVIGSLWKPSEKKRARAEWLWRPLVPDVEGLRRDFFTQVHSVEGGHMRVGQTFERLRQIVDWDGMWSDCEKMCKGCAVCGAHEEVEGNWGPLQPTDSRRLDGRRMVAFDIAGPFPKTAEGFTHILVSVDRDDNWPTISPLSATTAERVVEAVMRDIIAESGVPDVFLSDRASDFIAEYAQKVYDSLGVEKETTAARSPWADGAAEALVKLAKKVMKKVVDMLQIRWSQAIWLVLMVLRSRMHEGMGISPFEARFGKKMVLPSFFSTPVPQIQSLPMKEMRQLKDRIGELRDETALKMKEKFDKKLVRKEFKVEDLVWLKNDERQSSMEAKRIGPFKIGEILGGLNARIVAVEKGPAIGRRHDVVSIRNLTEYEADSIYAKKEHVVRDVIAHQGKGQGRKYQVVWEDGDMTWEPTKNLCDKSHAKDAKKLVVAEALLRYWDRNPRLKKPAGV